MHTATERVVQDAELADLSQPKQNLARHTLLQSFSIDLPDGRRWFGTLWKTPTRKDGRRIQVHDEHGAGLFDSSDCFDLSNARSALAGWLQGQVEVPAHVLNREPSAVEAAA